MTPYGKPERQTGYVIDFVIVAPRLELGYRTGSRRGISTPGRRPADGEARTCLANSITAAR
jgi:hypothetical protein